MIRRLRRWLRRSKKYPPYRYSYPAVTISGVATALKEDYIPALQEQLDRNMEHLLYGPTPPLTCAEIRALRALLDKAASKAHTKGKKKGVK